MAQAVGEMQWKPSNITRKHSQVFVIGFHKSYMVLCEATYRQVELANRILSSQTSVGSVITGL